MYQLNLILILYILGSDWIFDQRFVCMIFETSHVWKESLLPKGRGCWKWRHQFGGYGIIILSYLINLILSNLILSYFEVFKMAGWLELEGGGSHCRSPPLLQRCQRQVQGKLDPDPDQPKICKLLKNWLCIMEMVLYQNTFTTDKNADLDLYHKVLVAKQKEISLS